MGFPDERDRNLIRRAEQLKALGVKANKALPESYATGLDAGADEPGQKRMDHGGQIHGRRPRPSASHDPGGAGQSAPLSLYES